jgi:diguanylate cyclase (GGDEF)-like protein/PAS domain S-box-containing protein
MSQPLARINAHSDAGAAVLRLREANIRHLLVVNDDGTAFGMVTQTDLALRYGVEHFLRLRSVQEVVSDGLLKLPAALPVADAAHLMAQARRDAAIVEQPDGTLGIITERDLLKLVAQRNTQNSLGDIASFPLRSVPASSALLDARRLLIAGHTRHLGVIDDKGTVVGLLSLRDMLEILERTYATDLAETLRQRDEELLHSYQDLNVARQIIDSSEDALMLVDCNGQIESINPAFSRLTGHSAEESLGRAPDDLLVCESETPGYCVKLWEHVGQQRHWHGVIWCHRRDGTRRAWSMRVHAILADGKTTGRFAASFFDVTEYTEAKERLRLAATVFSHAREGIMITDAQGVIAEVNERFSHITGYTRDEVIGRKPNLLSSGRQGNEFYAAMWQTLEKDGHWTGEVWNRRKDGEVYAEFLTISAVRDSDDKIRQYVALFSDITAQKQYQQQLEHIAHYDALTGLPNRLLLADRMRQSLARSLRNSTIVAVCVMDLDGFKPINDTFGHKAGDYLLQEISRRLNDGIRTEDTAARIGGDEFVLLLSGLNSERDCEELLRRLLVSIAHPVFIQGQSVQVSASIGVTLYPSDRADADQLLRHADQAMYKAKALGKNRYHFFHLLAESRIQANMGLIGRIQTAIEKKQFVLHFQPKVDCRAGRVIGFEALVRWNHPILGMRLPGEFLPLIEQEEIIERLGEWVITQTLEQMTRWQLERPDLQIGVSINLAARQLSHGAAESRLAKLINRFPSRLTSRLTLEILESAALEEIDAVRDLMAQLQPQGVNFSLDDFGTGYSSLSHLKQLPVDELKIDRAFINDMLKDRGDLAIVEGVVGLAQAFDRRLVAEGVENIEQILMLLTLGCDVMQGYAFSRPIPGEQVTNWLDDFHPDPRWNASTESYPVREDFDLLLMEVGHRHWLEQVKNALLHGMPPPNNDYTDCHLTHWLDGQGAQHLRFDPIYLDLLGLHRSTHLFAGTLLDQPPAAAELSDQLARLEKMHVELLRHLRQLRANLSRPNFQKEQV